MFDERSMPAASRTYCHEEQLAWPHDAKQAVNVVKNAQEHLRLGGRRRLHKP